MPRLIVRDDYDERIVELEEDALTAGRSKQNKIPIRDEASSREHCEFRRQGDGYIVKDLNSRNGTLVNGCPINQHKLKHGDKVEVGNTLMIYTAGESRLDYIQRDTPAHLQAVGLGKGTAKNKPPVCHLVAMTGERTGERIPLDKFPFVIGRRPGLSLIFSDDRVSSKHAEVVQDENGRCVLKDLNSTNGTTVNDKRVTKAVLKGGDVIEVGANKLEFKDPQGAPPGVERKTPPSMPSTAPPGGGGPPPATGGKARFGLSREHLGMVVAGLISLGVVGAAYVGLPPVLRLFVGGSAGAAVDATNLLQCDPDFEAPSAEPGTLFPGWRVKGTLGEQFAADRQIFSQGRFALRLDSLETTARASEMICTFAQDLALKPDQVLVLRGQTRCQDSQGLSGCRVTWIDSDKQAICDSWSPVLSGNSAWQSLNAVFVPPPGAVQARFACAGLGAFGKAWFDALHLSQRAYDPQQDRIEVPHRQLRLAFEPRGIFALQRNATPLLFAGSVRVWTGDGKLMTADTGAVEPNFPLTTVDDFQTQVRLFDPGSGHWSKLTLTTLSLDGRLSLNYRLERDEATRIDVIEWTFLAADAFVRAGLLLNTVEGDFHETGLFPRTRQVRQVACGPTDNRLHITFGAPATVQLQKVESRVRFGAIVIEEPDPMLLALEFNVDLE